MIQDSIRPPAADLWTSGWFQLAGALLLGAALPFALGVALTPELLHLDLFGTSAVGTVAAIVVGFYAFRSMSEFPGIRVSYYVLPVFSSAFGAALAAFLMLRLEYSRPLFLAGFVVTVGWLYLAYFMVQRSQRLAFGVVPFGQVDSLYDIPGIRWQVLQSPRVPHRCRAIVADFHSELPDEWEKFLAEAALQGISVMHYKQLRQSVTGQVQIEQLSENANGTLVPNPSFLGFKMVVDVATAVIALVVLIVPLLLVALLVKLDSPGPVFFFQQRVGYRGRTFRVWKFRTMYVRTPAQLEEEAREAAKTLNADSRVTRLGRFLRRSRIDELPQLVNVIRTEMSWIGPRPEAQVLSRWYEQEIPFYRYRHIVRPGITGWAQVRQGHVAELDDVLHKLNYDFYYIANFSFWLDILIIMRTIKTMLTGFGAR